MSLVLYFQNGTFETEFFGQRVFKLFDASAHACFIGGLHPASKR